MFVVARRAVTSRVLCRSTSVDPPGSRGRRRPDLLSAGLCRRGGGVATEQCGI